MTFTPNQPNRNHDDWEPCDHGNTEEPKDYKGLPLGYTVCTDCGRRQVPSTPSPTPIARG
jgi:hypothetical protein